MVGCLHLSFLLSPVHLTRTLCYHTALTGRTLPATGWVACTFSCLFLWVELPFAYCLSFSWPVCSSFIVGVIHPSPPPTPLSLSVTAIIFIYLLKSELKTKQTNKQTELLLAFLNKIQTHKIKNKQNNNTHTLFIKQQQQQQQQNKKQTNKKQKQNKTNKQKTYEFSG